MKKNNVQVIYEGNFLRYVKKDNWEFVERHNCSGIVIIVAVTPSKKILFVEQFRVPVNKRVIEFPAGLVGDERDTPKESMAIAAKRELLEETGYKASTIETMMSGPVSSGSSADIVTMVRAKGLKKMGKGGGKDDEDIAVHEVPMSKVDGWLKEKSRKGCYVEPKVYTGLYFLSKYNT